MLIRDTIAPPRSILRVKPRRCVIGRGLSAEHRLITDNCLPAMVRVESGHVTLPRAAWGRALVALCNKSNGRAQPDVSLH